MASPCQINKCKPLVQKQKELFNKRSNKKAPSATERQVTKDVLDCSLKAENCLHEFKKNVSRMLKLAHEKAIREKNIQALAKIESIKLSLRKDLLKTDDYGWCFKFLYNINLY
jgi:hypothetical protein